MGNITGVIIGPGGIAAVQYSYRAIRAQVLRGYVLEKRGEPYGRAGCKECGVVLGGGFVAAAGHEWGRSEREG